VRTPSTAPMLLRRQPSRSAISSPASNWSRVSRTAIKTGRLRGFADALFICYKQVLLW
jgi:hypothetical protein